MNAWLWHKQWTSELSQPPRSACKIHVVAQAGVSISYGVSSMGEYVPGRPSWRKTRFAEEVRERTATTTVSKKCMVKRAERLGGSNWLCICNVMHFIKAFLVYYHVCCSAEGVVDRDDDDRIRNQGSRTNRRESAPDQRWVFWYVRPSYHDDLKVGGKTDLWINISAFLPDTINSHHSEWWPIWCWYPRFCIKCTLRTGRTSWCGDHQCSHDMTKNQEGPHNRHLPFSLKKIRQTYKWSVIWFGWQNSSIRRKS